MKYYFSVLEETAAGIVERYINESKIESYCIRNSKLWLYMESGDVILTTYDEEKASKFTPLEFN